MSTFGALDAAYCSSLKGNGNVLLKASKFEEAIEEYTKALEHAKKTLTKVDEVPNERFLGLVIPLLCNRSMVHAKMAENQSGCTSGGRTSLESARLAQVIILHIS